MWCEDKKQAKGKGKGPGQSKGKGKGKTGEQAGRPTVTCKLCGPSSWVFCDRGISVCKCCGTPFGTASRKGGKGGGKSKKAEDSVPDKGEGKVMTAATSRAVLDLMVKIPGAACIMEELEALLKKVPADDQPKPPQKKSWQDSLKHIEKLAAALRRKEYETATIEKKIAEQEQALAELRGKQEQNKKEVEKAREEHDAAHAQHRTLSPPSPGSEAGTQDSASTGGLPTKEDGPAGEDLTGKTSNDGDKDKLDLKKMMEDRRRRAAELQECDQMLCKRLKLSSDVQSDMEKARQLTKELEEAARIAVSVDSEMTG